MKQSIKLLSMLLTFFAMSFTLTSCSNDDDNPTSSIDDYYSEVTSVTGGGWTPQECSQFMNELNTNASLKLGPAYSWINIDRDQAIYYFDTQMKTLKAAFGNGLSGISGTLTIYVVLKNSSGKTIKGATLSVTTTSCTLN